uniref:Helix-turn-helix domain protein n=1 Tax=Siphoviridae sp. ctuy39 TaxID=2825719 RepID=A0A8S5VE23_9CAUD|nr:MAG TPA: helix-turn-helix domain protein [Siphoviridae sp. ctuy39]
MTIGQRIKNRRICLGLSVDEVALKLGKNRATIYRYEKDDIKDLPITVLEPLANVLETTPADLMGWGGSSDKDIENVFANDNLGNIIDNIGALSSREKTHFKKYLQLIEINRRKADNYIEQLLSIQQMDDDLSVMAAHERTDIKVTNEMRKHDDDIMMDDSEWE